MIHFYDGQIRRYVTQLIRLMSNFSYKDGKDQLVTVPVMYGDITRQVGHILRDNSENKIPSVPRMGLYITSLEQDRDRTSDASYTHKVNIRERAWDATGQEYLNTEGKNYTVERLMPSPYKLTANVDIWTSNTDQKLQILEQILTLFNPSLEIQTTDNYIDWASLSVVNLDTVNFSSRSIPVGTDSDIDVSSLTFSVPVYISAPVKVKRLGVITNIITSIFDESKGTIDLGVSTPSLDAWDDGIVVGRVDRDGNEIYETSNATSVVTTTYQNQGIYVDGNVVRLIQNGKVGEVNWRTIFEALTDNVYQEGISQLHIRRLDYADQDYNIVGTVAIGADETQLYVNWDEDTLPQDTDITGPAGTRNKVDYIIDPITFNPTSVKATGIRLLLLNGIGDPSNDDGPDAWKNSDNSDFYAEANDIIEWDGSNWNVVFEADTDTSIYGTVYTTNLNTGVQYRWDGEDWLKSVDGEYPRGTWRLAL